MSDYIKREDAERETLVWLNEVFGVQSIDESIGIFRRLRELPSADVAEIKHGRWIKISPAGIYECSECGQNVMTKDIDVYKRCHNCGARMDGEEE